MAIVYVVDVHERAASLFISTHMRLTCQDSLNVPDFEFLQDKLKDIDDLPSLFLQRYLNKNHYLEHCSFSNLTLIGQLEYFLKEAGKHAAETNAQVDP